jgi:hypothetical protein
VEQEGDAESRQGRVESFGARVRPPALRWTLQEARLLLQVPVHGAFDEEVRVQELQDGVRGRRRRRQGHARVGEEEASVGGPRPLAGVQEDETEALCSGEPRHPARAAVPGHHGSLASFAARGRGGFGDRFAGGLSPQSRRRRRLCISDGGRVLPRQARTLAGQQGGAAASWRSRARRRRREAGF